MIQVQDVTKAFAGKKLFENVSTTFPPGRRYGLTGPNGAGKTTFMKNPGGRELEPDTGTVSRPKRFSVLKQDQYAYEDRKVLDVVLMGNAALWEAMQEKERLLAKPDLTDEDGARLGELEASSPRRTLLGRGAGRDPPRGTRGLRGGPAPPDEGESRAATRSACCWRKRCFGKPTALAPRRRPTHSLRPRLHPLARGFPPAVEGTLIVISHDRHFLNAICTHIADID